MALSNKTLEGIQKSVKLHLNWLIKSIVGEEALTTAELKDLEGFTLLPSSSLDFIKKSFFLGRLSAVLRKKEYKEVTLSSVEKAMQTVTLSPIELLAIQEAKQSAGLHFKTLAADIEAGIYSKLAATNLSVVNEATVLNIVRDEVALAILEHKTWTTLAENLSQSLKTENSKKIQKIARTELHAAKQKGIVQAIANKVDIYGISDGPDSLVSVVTHTGRCEDCASLYEENGSYKIFKLSELLKNGTNVDSKHTRENGLHNHWKPVVPPAHPQCFCEIRYLPPGAAWQGKTLVLAAPEALQKAIGDSKLSAVQKPKGPPPSGPQAPATPGNVPGVASPAKAVGTAGAKPSSKANSNPAGIVYEYYAGDGQPPSDGGWESYQKQDGSTGYRRPSGSGKRGSGQEDEPVDQEAVDEALMNASKAFGLAGHSSATVLEKLNTAKIAAVKGTDEGTKGATESYVVALEDGPRAILKPPANFNNVHLLAGAVWGDGMQSIPVNTGHRREEATYHGYNMLGLTDAVPPTTIREHEGIDCSIQAWSENHKPVWKSILEDGDTKLHKEAAKLYGSIHDAPDNLVQVMLDMVPADKREAFIEQLSAGTVAAMVFNHNDQHFNNVLIDHDTWELKFIDNTAAFGNGLEGCKQQAHMEMHNMGMKLKIPEKLQTRMANTTLGDVKRSIGPYIEDWAVGQTYLRMKYMLHLQDTEGHLDYEKFRPTMGYGAEKYADKQVPRPGGFWAGTKEDQHEEFHRRKAAGLLQNQLFNSFAKQWLSDAEKLPDDHPDKIAAKEIADIGIFLGPGMATGATMYRSDKKHIAFEKTVKPGYPPKDIINATGILSEAPGKSAPEPKKILMSPRDLAAFGGVPKSPPPIPDDAKKTMKKEPAKTADDIKTAKPVKHKVFAKPGSNEEKKTIKKNLYIRLDSVWER